jgi:hypothetical protein
MGQLLGNKYKLLMMAKRPKFKPLVFLIMMELSYVKNKIKYRLWKVISLLGPARRTRLGNLGKLLLILLILSEMKKEISSIKIPMSLKSRKGSQQSHNTQGKWQWQNLEDKLPAFHVLTKMTNKETGM